MQTRQTVRHTWPLGLLRVLECSFLLLEYSKLPISGYHFHFRSLSPVILSSCVVADGQFCCSRLQALECQGQLLASIWAIILLRVASLVVCRFPLLTAWDGNIRVLEYSIWYSIESSSKVLDSDSPSTARADPRGAMGAMPPPKMLKSPFGLLALF